MTTHFPNGLSSHGLPVLPGFGDLFTTGTVYFVDSSLGDAGNNGKDPDKALATIDAAVGKCTANKGDIIVVMPGHAETISTVAGIACDVAGITIVGVGSGTLKPTLTFSAAASDINVSVANVTIKNIRMVSSVNNLVNFLDLDAGNFICEDCDFVTSSTTEALCFVDIATTKDDFAFRRCKFIQPTDPDGTDSGASTGCFYFVDSENIYIEHCYFYGQFESAIFHNKTTAAKNVWVRHCYGTQLLSGGEVFIQVANMEGGDVGSMFIVTGSADVAEANTWGTLSAKFFVSLNSSVGNDGGGGQLSVAGASAAT